jgi:hypothetical protein
VKRSFAVIGKFGIRHRHQRLESVVGHRLQMNPSVTFNHFDHHGFKGLGKLLPMGSKSSDSDAGWFGSEASRPFRKERENDEEGPLAVGRTRWRGSTA